ncbi:MAG: type IV secretory system conjugative DNA transfer family protein [Lacticaseibacillus paracasei]
MENEQLKHLIWRVVFSVFGGLLVYGVGSGLTRAVYAVKPDEAKSMIDKVLYVSNNLGNVAWLPLTFKGKPFVGGMILLAVVALVVLYALTNKKNYRPGEEHGSAQWGTHKDILPYEDTKNPDNNLLMTATEKLYLNDLEHKRPMKLQRNQFVTVIGGAGSGKTRTVVVPNLLQRSSSYVVTDTKGQTLKWVGNFFEKSGYKIKVLDLVTREHTDHFNVFAYIKNEDDVIEVVNAIMQNTTSPQSKSDPFFDKGEKALMQALFDYLRLEAGNPDNDVIANVPNVLDLVRAATIEEDAGGNTTPLDVIFEGFKKDFPDAFGLKQYGIFKLAPAKTAMSIVISLGVRLAPFDVPSIVGITSDDTLELEKLGDEKRILFLILPDQSETFNFLVSLVYQTLFTTLVDHADQQPNGRLHETIVCWQDEFANSGQIPQFDKRINTLRSRGIFCVPIVQELSQLKERYPKSYQAILGASDSLLYLGGHDSETAQYISKILGKGTIDVQRYGETKGNNGSFNQNYDKIARDLLAPDEVDRIGGDQSIYMLRGVPPFLSQKYQLEKHPRYKELQMDHSDYVYQPQLKSENNKGGEVETEESKAESDFLANISQEETKNDAVKENEPEADSDILADVNLLDTFR